MSGSLEASRSETRWHIIHTHKAHPDWSLRQIGRATGANHKTVKQWIDVYNASGGVTDQKRSGRNCLVASSALDTVKSTATKSDAQEVFSSARICQLLQAELGSTASPRTVRRALKASAWRYGYAKKMLMLKASHKRQRLLWAKRHLSYKTSFSKWMFTDSKVFLLHQTAAKAGVKVWYPEDCRPSNAIVKHSKGVHVYLGVTKFGVTKPIFVTGAGSKKSVYINPKSGLPYKGLSAEEYQKDVLPLLIRLGNFIFSAAGRWSKEWIFQQDNARPHAAKSTTQLLDELLPGRTEHAWPANSPDLSWIENMWSWAERKLQKEYQHITSIEGLKSAITDIFKDVPKEMLANHVRGMPKRLEKVVQNNGGPIM